MSKTTKTTNSTLPQICNILISQIKPDPEQSRREFTENDIKALAQSIENIGLQQEIILRKIPDDKYMIVDGERRFRAFKILQEKHKNNDRGNNNYDSIPARVIDVDDKHLGIWINILHKNYNPMEYALALSTIYESMTKDKNYANLANMIGKSRQNVGEYLSLLKLPEEIRDHAKKNGLVAFKKLKSLAASKISEKIKIATYKQIYDKALQDSKTNKNESNIENNNNDIPQSEDKDNKSTDNKTINIAFRKINDIQKTFDKMNKKSFTFGEDISDDAKEDLKKRLTTIIDSAKEILEKINPKES